MATNSIPHGIDELMTLAEDAADGAAIHKAAIGLLQNTETALRADAAALQTHLRACSLTASGSLAKHARKSDVSCEFTVDRSPPV